MRRNTLWLRDEYHFYDSEPKRGNYLTSPHMQILAYHDQLNLIPTMMRGRLCPWHYYSPFRIKLGNQWLMPWKLVVGVVFGRLFTFLPSTQLIFTWRIHQNFWEFQKLIGTLFLSSHATLKTWFKSFRNRINTAWIWIWISNDQFSVF